MYEIVTKEDRTPVTKCFEVRAPDVGRKAQTGRFVIVRVHDKGEHTPLTIADYEGLAHLPFLAENLIRQDTSPFGR